LLKKDIDVTRTSGVKMSFGQTAILVTTTMPSGCTCFHERPMKSLLVVLDGLFGSTLLNLRSKNIWLGVCINLGDIPKLFK